MPVQLKLWIDEKMLTAQDVSYDEARNLHTKWQKHQAFMAELAANKDWLDKVDKVSGATGAAGRGPLDSSGQGPSHSAMADPGFGMWLFQGQRSWGLPCQSSKVGNSTLRNKRSRSVGQ